MVALNSYKKIVLRNEILRSEKTFKPNLPGLKNLAGLVFEVLFNFHS